MIVIIQKTHNFYLLIEIIILALVSLVFCFSLSVNYATTEGEITITNLDNFSSKWVFTLPEKEYTAVSIKQTADIIYNSMEDIESWPFNAQITTTFSDEVIEDTFDKIRVEVNDKIGKPIKFFEKDFIAKKNPVISVMFINRNPLIEKIKVTFQYFVPCDANILGYLCLALIVVLPKPRAITLIILYFAAFSPITAGAAGLFYALFCGYYVVVMLKHVKSHSISTSRLNKHLNVIGHIVFALFTVYSVFSTGFSSFKISQSPFVILSGMCIVQIVGLISFSQFNIPIVFDFIGGLCVYIPYVLNVFLPIYYSRIEASSITTISAYVLGMLALMCSILSESSLERDDVVSEDVMGVISKEASSSGEIVVMERDESLRIGKVRRINIVSLIIVALPFIFGVVALAFAKFKQLEPATFEYIKDE